MSDTSLSTTETILGLRGGTYPFVSNHCDIGGARLHYVDIGEGPVVFLLHGNPTWSLMYRDLITELSNSFRCIAVDLAGFGLSQAPPDFSFLAEDHADLIAKFLVTLNIENATLIAHDWGGPIGLWAGLSTGRVTRLCLGNTWCWAVNGDFHFEWFSRLFGGPIGRWASEKYSFFIRFVMPGAMIRRKLQPEEIKAYLKPFEQIQPRTGLHVFPKEIIGAGAWLKDVEALVSRFRGPVHFVWPDKDIAFRTRELERWRQLLPQATVTDIVRCGHFLWIDAPDDTHQAVRTFLDQQNLTSGRV